MNEVEKEEALQELALHYGMPAFLEMVEKIVKRVSEQVLSVPLDKDPEKAAITLYAARMKADGAEAVRLALKLRVDQIKQASTREKRK